MAILAKLFHEVLIFYETISFVVTVAFVQEAFCHLGVLARSCLLHTLWEFMVPDNSADAQTSWTRSSMNNWTGKAVWTTGYQTGY